MFTTSIIDRTAMKSMVDISEQASGAVMAPTAAAIYSMHRAAANLFEVNIPLAGPVLPDYPMQQHSMHLLLGGCAC